MDLLVGVLSIAVGIAVLLTTKADVSNWVKAVLYVAELTLMAVSFVQLGWLGLALAAAAIVVGTLVSSIRLAMKKEHLLVTAEAQGTLTREDAERLYDWAKTNRRLRGVDPITRCQFILALSHRDRDRDEAQAMLEPLGMLHVIYGTDPHVLTEKFDRMMRIWDEPADRAERVADQVVAASKASAATFEEMLDALATFDANP